MRGAAEMTTWEPMPAVVWDKDGNKWEYKCGKWGDGHGYWLGTISLLEKHGPVTDTRPIKVGDAVSLEEFVNLPEGSIAAVRHKDPWLKTQENEFMRTAVEQPCSSYEISNCIKSPWTVLRIGWGD